MNDLDNFEIKEILSDIIRGYSISLLDGNIIFIKHFGIKDYSKLNSTQTLLFKEAVNKNLPTKKNKLAYLIKEKIWTEEAKLKENIALVNNLKENLAKNIYNLKQIEIVKQDIKNLNNEINKLELEKNHHLGYTAEVYVSKKIDEYYIVNSLFTDDNLTNQIFTYETFRELENEELNNIINIYNDTITKFNATSIEKCSLVNNFAYLFYLCEDNPFTLFGKPLIDLTSYQIELFNYSKFFKRIIANTGQQLPEDIAGDPEKIKEWASATVKTQTLLEENQDKDGIGTFNMTPEDIKKLKSEGMVSLADEAKKKGGNLTMEQIMALHGYNTR